MSSCEHLLIPAANSTSQHLSKPHNISHKCDPVTLLSLINILSYHYDAFLNIILLPLQPSFMNLKPLFPPPPPAPCGLWCCKTPNLPNSLSCLLVCLCSRGALLLDVLKRRKKGRGVKKRKRKGGEEEEGKKEGKE